MLHHARVLLGHADGSCSRIQQWVVRWDCGISSRFIWVWVRSWRMGRSSLELVCALGLHSQPHYYAQKKCKQWNSITSNPGFCSSSFPTKWWYLNLENESLLLMAKCTLNHKGFYLCSRAGNLCPSPSVISLPTAGCCSGSGIPAIFNVSFSPLYRCSHQS